MRNGIYFLHPEGSAWIAADIRDDAVIDCAYESDAATHQAANDRWAGVVPSDEDREIDGDDARAIVALVMGDDTDPGMVAVSRKAATFTLRVRDDGGATHEVVLVGDRPDKHDITEECAQWLRGGDWGSDGARVGCHWSLLDEDGDEIDSGYVTVEIEPDHAGLIAAALGGKWANAELHERCCGTDPDDHDWTSAGEGGCRENPGVWSTGGTSLVFYSHCRTCGLHRVEHHTGSQRNPGEHDTVEYTMPETWCEECQAETCGCAPVEAE